MAKVTFTKLALKKQDLVQTISINGNNIEVKQYLPVNEKLELIARVLNGAHDENNFPNPVKVHVLSIMEIISAYTNITFTEKQKEDIAKLFDLFVENGIVDMIMNTIPQEERDFVNKGIQDTITAVYAYQNSVMGILDTVGQDYSNLDLDATKIQQTIADPENLDLLKSVLTKLG